MSEIIRTEPMTLPEPTTPINIRRATRGDLPFIDSLQKKHSKALGFFPRAQMIEYLDAGHVLVAEHEPRPSGSGESLADARGSLGYIISKDRYLKRDELGVVFQLCVAPGYERQFIAANLLREVFERSSYGCRLYCCWCAQDLAANRFWESMGFVPIAYRCGGLARRAGGRGQRSEVRGQRSDVRGQKGPRVHIYWQKRIRANDTTTPYWFPAKTEGGAIREDRIILPIPPGMRWTDALPVLVGSAEARGSAECGVLGAEARGPSAAPSSLSPQHSAPSTQHSPLSTQPSVLSTPQSPAKRKVHRPNGIWIAPAPAIPAEPALPTPSIAPSMMTVAKKKPRRTAKADPARKAHASPVLIAKARELRDRWMDHVETHGLPAAAAKYEVSRGPAPRRLEDAPRPLAPAPRRLAA